jgi:hypothetical protein
MDSPRRCGQGSQQLQRRVQASLDAAAAPLPGLASCYRHSQKGQFIRPRPPPELGDCAVEPLIRALAHADVHVRPWAARALGTMPGPVPTLPLVRALADPECAVRHAVVEALGNLRDIRALDALLGALKDDENEVRSAAAVALPKPGDAAVRSADRCARR